MTLENLLQVPDEQLTDEQRVFLDFYYRLLPVNDSNCPMNKICHYIEDIDFNIKKKVHSSFGFDYTLLQSEGFEPNRKIYEKIYEMVEQHVKKWNDNKKSIKDKMKPEEGFDKVAAYIELKNDLEKISTNDEIIVNHLITLFYEDKPSYNKNMLWDMYRKTIFTILHNKTNVAYFPKKNPNGSIKFLEENYSIEKVIIHSTDRDTTNTSNVQEDTTKDNENTSKSVAENSVTLVNEVTDIFDNIKKEFNYDD